MKKFFSILFLIIVLYSNLKALEIYNKNKFILKLSSQLFFYRNCDSCSNLKHIKKREEANNFSNIRLDASQQILEDVEFGAVTDWGIFTQSSSDDSHFLYNRYSFIYVKDIDSGTFQYGKTFSVVNDYVIKSTVNKLRISSNDAGISNFKLDQDGSNYGLENIKNAFVYKQTYKKLSIGLQFQGEKKGIRNISQIINKKNITNLIDRDYAIGGTIKYDYNDLILSVGYIKVKNIIDNKGLEKSKKTNYDESLFQSNIYLVSTYLKGDNINFAIAGGYYENYQSLGQKHLGGSVFASLELQKIIPYIGYEVIYGLNMDDEIAQSMYKQKEKVTHTFDKINIVVGARYTAGALSFGVEYSNDLRTKKQRKTSMLNNNHNEISTFFISYKI